MIHFLNLFFQGFFYIFLTSFLPGMVLFILIFRKGRIFWPAVFGLGILYTFLKVYMLAILGIYSGGAVWVLSLLELSLAVWLILKKGKFFSFKLEKGEIWLAAIFFVLGVKRVALALFYPFFVGDVWASWNRWAVVWFRLKKFSFINDFTYPQLLPANWSHIYKLAGGVFTPEYYAHAFTLFFYLFILWILFQLKGVLSKATIFVFSAYFLFNQSSFFSVDIGSGLADMPAAFFVILSVFYLKEYLSIEERKYIYMSFLMAAGAALTKQAGVFFWLILPILFIVFRKEKRIGERFREIKKPFLWSLIPIVSWYGVARLSQATTWPQIQDALRSFSLFERLQVGAYIIVQNFGIYLNIHSQSKWLVFLIMAVFWAVAGLGVWVSFKKSNFYRWLLLIFIIPYLIVWTFVYSYDIRNSLIAFILFLFIVFDGLVFTAEKFFEKWKQAYFFRDNKNILFIFLAVVLTIGVFFQKPVYAHLANPLNFNDLGKDIVLKKGKVFLNEKLVKEYFKERERGKEKIITNFSDFTTKLHLEDVALMVNFKDKERKDWENFNLVIFKGRKEEYVGLKTFLQKNSGIKEVVELYKNEGSGEYLLELKK